jgi:Baseplate J-like protein
MSGGTCGCTTQPCGCCDGVAQLTPAAIFNRPGLDALAYRVGTHAQFFETMQARISTIRIDGVGSDGQTVQTWRPLEGLTTRDRGDLSIALLDGWATVADVLTFYQERIANEGFLRTATERRSVLELARLVGYTLRPGVAATVYLAYTIDDKQTEPTVIPTGARSQSVPAPGESAQSFETSEDLVARAAWNNLQVRVRRPQNIALTADEWSLIGDQDLEELTVDGIFDVLRAGGHALAIDTIQVAGTATNLKPGDKLLLVFSGDGSTSVVRSVATVDTQFTDQRTAVALQPIDRTVVACAALLAVCIDQLQQIFDPAHKGAKAKAISEAQNILREVYLGLPSTPEQPRARISRHDAETSDPVPTNDSRSEPDPGQLGDPRDWFSRIRGAADVTNLWSPVKDLGDRIHQLVSPAAESEGSETNPGLFIKNLLIPPVPQAANSLRLPRDLATSFGLRAMDLVGDQQRPSRLSQAIASSPSSSSDASSQLLVHFAPVLRDTFYRAWSGANVNATAPSLKNVYVLRARTTLFGAGASKLPAFFTDTAGGHVSGQVMPQNCWQDDWRYADDETDNNAFLDGANEAIIPGSYVLAHVGGTAPTRQVLKVTDVSVSPRSEYGLSGPSTMLVFKDDPQWRRTSNTGTASDAHADATTKPPPSPPPPPPPSQKATIAALRKTQIYAQSEPLTLIEEPITDAVSGQQIELGALHSDLKSGRWVILSGERADIPGVSGVPSAELLMISAVTQGFDAALPGDQTHTTLTLATPTAYQYKRETLTIYGNVVKATHGETRNEILGSGNGAQPLQSFTLKQPPLTFVAAPTAAGAESTLHVYVDNVEWHETDSLAGLGPRDHHFVTATDDAGNTQVTFGNGVQGARLPTGTQNVAAVYRSGIGVPGNVKAQQVSLLQTRPLGVMSVINPLRASGGADKESRDLARDNVPLSVMSLDRLVSVADYADFTRNFAGIAKAIAQRTSDGRRQLIHLTIAGADDIPIDPSSDLYRNLLAAFRKLGDRDLPVKVDLCELTALVLSAGVKLLPDYVWEPVATALRARILDAFGFGKRALGQPALLCEVLSVMQAVPGVAYVDVDAFGGVTEKTTSDDDARVLRSPDEITNAVKSIVIRAARGQFTADRVAAFPGGSDHGVIRPAELAIFTPAVPDTLILNQLP